MGEVWSAEHTRLGRPAAIKVIRPEKISNDTARRAQLLERFEREARATSALTSPHTVEIYDFGRTSDGAFYYAMELLQGYSLDRLVTEEGPVDPARVIHILRQVCESLAEAHARGLIHRDIKPANIQLSCRGLLYDFVKVLDFGLVKEVGAGGHGISLTEDDIVLGSPAFMPPESVNGGAALDERSEVYSLGCVAFWLLTGRLVFERDEPLQAVMAHALEAAPRPSDLVERRIPAALEALVMRCLAKNPAERPQSAKALQRELSACAANTPWTQDAAEQWWTAHRGAQRERISFESVPSSTAEIPPHEARPACVLVVDDDAAVRLVLAGLLSQAGYEALPAGSGPEALALLETRDVDVMLTDLSMPGMSGMQLVHKVAEREPGLPMIVLTAHGSVPVAVAAMKAGACDFMLKPFDRADVRRVVDKAIRLAAPPAQASVGLSGDTMEDLPTAVSWR